ALGHFQTLNRFSGGAGAGNAKRYVTFTELCRADELHVRIEIRNRRQANQQQLGGSGVGDRIGQSDRKELDLARPPEGLCGTLECALWIDPQCLGEAVGMKVKNPLE